MTTAREKAIEVLARAICANEGYDPDALDEDRPFWSEWKSWTDTAEAALVALSAAGFAVVPKTATETLGRIGEDASASIGDSGTLDDTSSFKCKRIYEAMVAAADLARLPEEA